ncbi:BspA family leucine-rich repeat surface protein [Paenibacillus barengoltzii]|uniref:BspA family leucine-rich repeat surface protein n=1 Tax=Paenibacillus barengoltzii TaxID=343517 RepID=UPI003F8AEE7C
MHERKNVYSLRKLSVGLASVIVGTCFFISNGQQVKADTVNVGERQASTVIQQDSSKKQEQDSNEQNDQTNVSNSKTEQQQSTNERNDVENVESNLNDTNKLDNATKPVESEANQKFDQAKDQFKQETTKADIANSSVIEGNDEGKTIQKADVSAKAEATKKAVAVVLRADSSETTLNLKGTNAIDPQTLKENKIETIVKADPARGIDPVKFASNGGFDPKIWGTMDTSKWQLDSSGNITGYTGDMSHIIIPNSADFAKVGKSYSQIGISSYEMQLLGGENNSKANTLAISLTDSRKVKASDTNWNSTFDNTLLKQANLEGLDTSNVTDMSSMFGGARSLTSLDVSKWDTGNVTDMINMFNGTFSLNSLDVSNWDTSNVTDMSYMFSSDSKLALIVNDDKFADYLVKNNFANSRINSGVKSVTTDNTKLLQLLTSDAQHNSANKTIVFTFPANYSPDLAKYHLTKNGNTYQIKQSADYNKPYLQGTVLINATDDITEHHIDTTKPYKLSDTWQPNYDKLVLAHKNSDGTVSFDEVQLPKIPGYKAVVKTVANPVNSASALFTVSFMSLSKPATFVPNDTKPAETVSPATPATTEVAKPIKTEHKATTPVAIKTVDLSNDAVTTTPDVSTWQVADEPDQDTYQVSNGQYAVELPHISNAQLHVIANDSTKDSILFGYKGQNSKYVFKIKFVNGHYLLTTYKIKSGKLVKLIDYNFIKSSKMIDVILDWLQLE